MNRTAAEQVVKFSLGVVLLGLIIEGVSVVSILPGTHDTLGGLASMWRAGSLQHNLQVSSARWLIGWSIGAVIGVVTGFLTGRVRAARIGLEGFFVILRAVPFICLVPISILVFGLNESGKFFLVGWASATVTWVLVHEGARNVPPQHHWRALSLGASRTKWIFRVLIPASADAIFSALRASLSIGLIVVAVAEMSGVYERSSGYWWSEGLGYRMFRSLDEARNDLLMASVVTFAALGIVGDLVFQVIWRAVAALTFRLRQRRVRAMVEAVGKDQEDVEFGWGKSQQVRVEGLTAGYGESVVIDGFNLTIAPGETISIVGPSGCGKTTLVRAIGRFADETFRVSDGVRLGGEAVLTPGPGVGIVMQESPVFTHMTVWDNICFGSWVHRLSAEEVNSTALYLLREFGLSAFASARAGTLSGGQRQRVALATTVANRPALLLLDEPFGALDAITRRRLQAFYNEKVNSKVSAVFVTHDVEEALIVGDRVRIGIQDCATEIIVDKEGLPPHVWELGESFGKERARVLAALEELSVYTE
jgi:ABC-type nitrate/sulfonate/bicarbonate transport system ATPase subunit/ABC-type nitrate/sulfonate/bicarbonate transport system permease component